MSALNDGSKTRPSLSLVGEVKDPMPSPADLSPGSASSSSASPPAAGSPITRAQTHPFSFHSLTLKSPRPAPGPVQEERPSNLQHGTEALPKTSQQGKRASSEPFIMPSSPTSPTRPSAAGSRVSSTSHYGRHANEWLFGSFSVRETVKGVWKGHEGKGK
jgi:hypothetical protein